MKLPATSRFGRVEGFKKLHIGGDYDGRIPIFSGQYGTLRLLFRIQVAVVFNDIFVTENPLQFPCGLLNNTGIGNYIDDSCFAVPYRMLQGKGHP
ncbi:MAG: hypothetical protein BWY09_01281 [Candidatus Hydrogenedentes bacterium ADurb.Bin179]|nr:MAG: hypothetical protein BWY09_01281 [Candidatus Hydrogenedentes bacterium ADurb.Bin179]